MVNVAVVCRKKAFEETRRKQGWFSYPVSDLDWTFYPVEDGETVNKDVLARNGHDVIFWEDWVWNDWTGKSHIPIYAAIVDSNTSAKRRNRYLARAIKADVLLIDQDKLTPFGSKVGKPVFRWQYAVNEHVFAPHPKTVDVAYHVAYTDKRAVYDGVIRSHCRLMNYSLTRGNGLTIDQLAARYGAARIVVHKSTMEQCRSHRFFDALASGACLLTDRVWSVAEDRFQPGVHFAEWQSEGDLQTQITDLLDSGRWKQIAETGRAFVLRFHTWQTRAEQLKGIIEATWNA